MSFYLVRWVAKDEEDAQGGDKAVVCGCYLDEASAVDALLSAALLETMASFEAHNRFVRMCSDSCQAGYALWQIDTIEQAITRQPRRIILPCRGSLLGHKFSSVQLTIVQAKLGKLLDEAEIWCVRNRHSD